MSSYSSCPLCGASVKLENLSVHMRRVHPLSKEKVDLGGEDATDQSRRSLTLRGRALNRKLLYALVAAGVVIGSLAIYGLALSMSPPADDGGTPDRVDAIDIYLQATCGCCHQYLAYLEMNGYEVTPHELTDLSGIKENHGIPEDMWSCHTSVIGPYFVEGHVPIEVIRELMKQRPAIGGISLPGMPAGSPGMGGVQAAPFVIYAIEGGQASVFMEV